MPLSNQADLQTYVTVTIVYDFKCNKQVRNILFLSTMPLGGEWAQIYVFMYSISCHYVEGSGWSQFSNGLPLNSMLCCKEEAGWAQELVSTGCTCLNKCLFIQSRPSFYWKSYSNSKEQQTM